jgi:uncharacterized protein (UPF0261 family)
MPHVVLLGTLDTKLDEILYVRSRLLDVAAQFSTPLQITLIDCGRQPTVCDEISISHTDLVTKYSVADDDGRDILSRTRGQAIEFIAGCATRCMREIASTREIHGIIGAGGSGGTSLIAAVMRDAVPFGMPKFIVSTVASGDTGPIVGETDITLMYSVVDIAGTNELLCSVLDNAAGAMVGMASAYERNIAKTKNSKAKSPSSLKTRIGITMFGVTTPCVDKIRSVLEENYPVEVYVFHATGHGGKAMERLVEEGRIDAVLDVTTTEICDFIAGGNMSAGPNRLEAALKRGIPYVLSLGATDMVNFGPMDSVPQKYKDRKLLVHNSTVTLMRTSSEECRKVGEFIVNKVKTYAKDPKVVEIWIPGGGASSISIPGGPFEDSGSDAILSDTVRLGLKGSGVQITEDKRDINNDGFASDIARSLMALVNTSSGTNREGN